MGRPLPRSRRHRPLPLLTPAAPRPAAASPAQAVSSAADERALVDKYCVACHNTKAKATGLDSSLRLTLDDVDFDNVPAHDAKLELVVRKLRAGHDAAGRHEAARSGAVSRR